MICSACGVTNSADSKFCKACGREITADAFPAFVPGRQITPPTPEERTEQVKRLLEMAFWHSDAGNDPAAIKAAQAALALDSECITALSLLGCLFERTGEIDLAIEAFERVVDMNPDSVADAEKLHALRNGVHLAAIPQPASYRWIPPAFIGIVERYPSAPVIGGVAAAFLVAFVGLLLLVPIAKGGTKPVSYARPPLNIASISTNQSAPATTPAQGAMMPELSLGNSSAELAGTGGSDTIGPIPKGSTDPFANFPAGMNNDRISRFVQARRSSPGPLPPVPDTNGMPSVYKIQPISVVPTVNSFNTVPQHQLDVVAPSAPTTAPPAVAAIAEGPAPPPSHIRISFGGAPTGDVTGDSSGSQRSGQTTDDTGGSLQQQAIQLQNKGDYRGAESSYRSAISAYKSDISAGRNVDFARRGIDACDTGIQICRASE